MKIPPALMDKLCAVMREIFEANFFNMSANKEIVLPPTQLDSFEPEERKKRKRKKGGSGGGSLALSQQENLPRFDEFWAICPRKVAKGATRKAYKAALIKTTPEKIIEGMARYASVERDPKFICHPSTWLNHERWDDVEPAPGSKFTTQDKQAVLRRITALEKERSQRVREFDDSRVKEIDEQLKLERASLA